MNRTQIRESIAQHVQRIEQSSNVDANTTAIVQSLALLTMAVLDVGRCADEIEASAKLGAKCLDYISDHLPGDR